MTFLKKLFKPTVLFFKRTARFIQHSALLISLLNNIIKNDFKYKNTFHIQLKNAYKQSHIQDKDLNIKINFKVHNGTKLHFEIINNFVPSQNPKFEKRNWNSEYKEKIGTTF
jgi:hypothetical protein